jgi:hypothetical protein
MPILPSFAVLHMSKTPPSTLNSLLAESKKYFAAACYKFGFFRDLRVIFIWFKMNVLRAEIGQKPGKTRGPSPFDRRGGRELRIKARPPLV